MSKVDAIKSKIKIAPFVAQHTRGLKPMRNRRFMVGFCPFHQAPGAKLRKFWVNVDDGLCNCFVPRCAADKPMDVINFYARVKGIPLHQAIEELWEVAR